MNNKIFIVIIIIGAIGVGYVLGTSFRKSDVSPPLLQTPAKPLSSSIHHSDQESASTRIPGAHHIHALTFDAKGNLLLGTHGGLFKSVDAGKTWQKVEIKGSVNAEDWMSIVADPRDRNVLYAGGHDLGIIKSMDGGIMWMRADEGIRGTDIHGLTINQRNPEYLFAYSVNNGVFKSKDGGVFWKRMDDGPENPGVRSFGYLAVQTSMDKSMGWDNWGLLLAGTSDGLFQSFSCFCGWTKTSEVFNNATVYSLADVESEAEVMYASTKEGVWKTIDAGNTWNQLEALKGVKITALAIHPQNAKIVIASSEEGVIYKSNDAGKTFKQLN